MQNKKKQVTDPPNTSPAMRTLFSGTKAKIKNNSKKTRRTNIVDKGKTKKTQYHEMDVAGAVNLSLTYTMTLLILLTLHILLKANTAQCSHRVEISREDV